MAKKQDNPEITKIRANNQLLQDKLKTMRTAYKQLQISEERLKLLFEFAPDAYYLNDLKGNFIDGNKAAVDLLGYRKEELIGKNLLKKLLLPGDQRSEATVNFLPNIISKPTGPEEFTLIRKSGKRILLELLKKPIKIHGKKLVLVAARDITDRKHIENELRRNREELEKMVAIRTSELREANFELKHEINERQASEQLARESEQKYRSFIDTSTDIVFQVSERGIIEFVSPRVEELYGYKVSELIGEHIKKTTPSEELLVALKAMRKILKGKTIQNFALKQRLKNGTIVPMEINAVPIETNGKINCIHGIMRDISARDKTEQVLRESEERYRDLVEKANIAILIDDTRGNIRYHNKKVTDIFGFTPDEIKKMSVKSLVHPIDQKRVLAYHSKRVSGRRTRPRYEFRGQHKEGKQLFVEVHATPVREGSQITGTRSYLWDITERRLAEIAREKSEKRYRTLFNNMRDGSLVISLDGQMLDYNKSFLRMTGYHVKKVEGTNWFDLFPQMQKPSERKMFVNEVLKKKYSKIYEKELQKSDKSVFPVELRAYLISDDPSATPLVWIMIRDISERKKIEKEIRMLAQTVRSVRECVCVTDTDDNILFVNDAFLKTYGYTRAELTGRNISIVRPEKYSAEINSETKKGGWEGELINIRRNGEQFPVFLSTSLIKDENNKAVAMVGVVTDISERKKLETQFRQAQKMEAIGQLAGGIAHDFNNILTAINGYAELVLMKMEAKNPNFKEITGILKAGKRASNLVRQLLAFSRKQMIEPKIIVINGVITELDKMLHRLIGEDIQVRINLEKNLGYIKADPGQIEQILINLIVNARDAINQKGLVAEEKKITIETSNKFLDKEFVKNHAGSQEGMHICLAISDTGIGMNSDVQDKIFEPFFTTKDKIKGTGLGLATVYGIVKQNNGCIYVYSEENKGTTVQVFWPLIDAHDESKSLQSGKVSIKGGKETILFVEDNEAVRAFTVSALKTIGYTVLAAANGKAALNLIKQNKVAIDLIITDVIMPEMGGKELADSIIARNQKAKILFTSGYTDNHILNSSTLNEGINFIHKPFSIESMATKIRQVLDN